MASIVPKVNKNSISIAHTSISNPTKEKKLSKPKKTTSSNLNFENEIKLNRDLKSLCLNISTKSLNSKNSLSSSHQSINSLFKLTSPTTPTFVNSPTSKKSSFKLFHSNESSSGEDSETETLSPKALKNKSESIPTSPTSPTNPVSPNSSNKANLNLNINLLIKDITALNFKYKNKYIFDNHPTIPTSSKNVDKVDLLLNTIKKPQTKNHKMDSSAETLVNSSTESIDSTVSQSTLDSLKNLTLSSPAPPPTTKLPDLPPPPPKPAPKYLPPPPPLSRNDINLNSFDIVKTIGTGSFGRVHLVKSRANNKFYAMKAIPKGHIAKEQQIEHIQEEKRILSQLHHPLFIQLSGTFQTRTHLFIVTNYVAGGELFAVLKKKVRFMNNIAKFYAAEVTIALEYLHSKDIIYRDLKPENIMLDITGHIKLVDLGFAKHVPDVTYTLCGTPEYMAPEVILSKAYGKAVDWYALGILIYEMLCGYPPFYDQDQLQLYKKILSGKIHWPSYVTEEAKDLIKQLITPDLTKRFGNLKNGANDIKQHEWFAGVEWAKVEKLGIAPPFIPEIQNEGDTRHFQRYSEPCDKEYYISQDQEALLDGANDYFEYFKDF